MCSSDLGKRDFTLAPLPEMAQWTTYRAAAVVQANADTLPDLLLMGNFYDYHVEIGRQDADHGTLLINRGKGNFEVSGLPGLNIDGQVRKIQPIMVGGKPCYLIARNNASLLLVTQQKVN